MVDGLFQWVYITFRNVLGGRLGDLPPIAALDNGPALAAPDDYEALATTYSNRYRGAYIINFLLGFVAVLLALVPLSGLLPEHVLHEIAVPLSVAEILCIAIIMLIHWHGRDPEVYETATSRVLRKLGFRNINQGWRQRWGHARLAAEQVRFSPLMLGFPGTKLFADNILDEAGEKYRETAGILHGLAAQCAAAPATDAYIDNYRRHFSSLVANQRVYHRNNAHRYHHIHHNLHRIAGICFYLTLAACLLHLAFHHPLLSVLAALLPALGATCHGILASGEFMKLAEQSREMSKELEKVEEELAAAPAMPLPALETQVRGFFTLVVQDAIGWHVTLRDKDVQVA